MEKKCGIVNRENPVDGKKYQINLNDGSINRIKMNGKSFANFNKKITGKDYKSRNMKKYYKSLTTNKLNLPIAFICRIYKAKLEGYSQFPNPLLPLPKNSYISSSRQAVSSKIHFISNNNPNKEQKFGNNNELKRQLLLNKLRNRLITIHLKEKNIKQIQNNFNTNLENKPGDKNEIISKNNNYSILKTSQRNTFKNHAKLKNEIIQTMINNSKEQLDEKDFLKKKKKKIIPIIMRNEEEIFLKDLKWKKLANPTATELINQKFIN